MSAAAAAGADGSEEPHWVQQSRQDTPGCRQVAHFNNAGAALQPQAVLGAVQQYLAEEATWGGYETAERRAEDLQRPYTALAQLLNCSPQEVAIVGSATSAWGQVFWGIPFKQGDIILTSQAEYGSNFLAYLQAQKRYGVQVQVIPETPEGDIDIQALQHMLAQQPKPVLVSISHVPTISGRVYDAAAVGAAAAAAGVPYLLDACQSAGQMPLDVQQLQCDFLTGTSRKYFRGPWGIGFLYARSRHLHRPGSLTPSGSSGSMVGWEPAMIDIHGAEWLGPSSYRLLHSAKQYEQYEVNFAAKVGFGAAVQYCLQQDLSSCWQRTQQLAAHLRARLAAEVPGCVVQDRGRVLCGIVSFTLASHPAAADVKVWLRQQQPPINVSVSSIGSTRLDFEQRGLREVVRASVSYYNSEQEVQHLVSSLQRLVAARKPLPQPAVDSVTKAVGGLALSADEKEVEQGSASEADGSAAVVGLGTPVLTKERRVVG